MELFMVVLVGWLEGGIVGVFQRCRCASTAVVQTQKGPGSMNSHPALIVQFVQRAVPTRCWNQPTIRPAVGRRR